MDRGYQGQGSVARRIMDLARWAASADNAQPWRFEFTGNHGVRVHAHDLRADSGVFDYQGAATQLALGGLIETASQAASLYGCGTQVQWGRTGVPSQYEFDLNFEPQAGLAISPLARCISSRATQRGALSRQALSAPDKQALQRAVGPYQILWLEGADRRATAWLNYRLAGPRLAMPESYPNLAVAFDPDANALYTPRRMPVASTPLDPVSRRLVVWALQNQRRMQRTSAVLGTAMTRLQLDLLPGLRCGAHLALLAPLVPNTLADHVCAGRTFARLWLTAEQ